MKKGKKVASRPSFKLDLHTHSSASPDGALTIADYYQMLDDGRLDYIAITDHNRADEALRIQAELGELGDRIIVGEEIRTTEGEIIGLYLTGTINSMQTPEATIDAIKGQGGLVCIPHPFEDVRRGISKKTLDRIAKKVDMIEVHNGRAVFQNKSKQAYAAAAQHGLVGVASSDSHACSGWGRTYSEVSAEPSRDTLQELLRSAAHRTGFPGLRAVLYPKYNRLKKRVSRRA